MKGFVFPGGSALRATSAGPSVAGLLELAPNSSRYTLLCRQLLLLLPGFVPWNNTAINSGVAGGFVRQKDSSVTLTGV